MSETTQTTAPAPGSAEHDTAMTSRFEGAQVQDQATTTAAPTTTTEAAKATKPEGLPDKFWDAEKGEVRVADLAKSYTELESGKGKETASEATTVQAGEAQAAEALKDVGLSFDKFQTEFLTNGKLSEETYKEIEAKNIPRKVVDAFIASQTRLAEGEATAIRNDVFSVVGGEDKYGELTAWMKTNIPVPGLQAYNGVMDSRDVGQIKLAVSAMAAKMLAAQGSEPKLLDGGKEASSTDVFRSTQELTRAMADPRYAKDPAYRQDVQTKLARSNIM